MVPVNAIHPTAIVEPGASIGEGTRVWHWAHVCAGARIGPGCVLGQGVYVGPGVTIGAGVKLQNNVSVFEGVTLEDEVFCGPSMVFTNVIDPRAFIARKAEIRPTQVCRGASMGANCTILCGVRIGRFAMIGAGAVVTRDVADFELVVGNPARRIGWVSRSGARLAFGGDAGEAHCPATGERYLLSDGRVSREE